MSDQRYTLDQIANVQNYLHRELECPVDPTAICERLLVGQGDDTYDPLCALPKGHEGRCKPSDYHMP